MEITQLYQGKSPTCGQHSVAMVTGRPIEEVYLVFGHKKGTYTREVVAALRKFGLNCSDQRVAIGRNPIPDLCILAVTRKGTRHWCVYHQGTIYCSSNGTFTYESYKEDLRIHSCIKIL